MTALQASEACVGWLLRWRGLVVAACVAALAGAVVAYGRAVDWDFQTPPVDNGIEIWFLEDDPALVAYREFQGAFGNDEAILVALRAPESVFARESLELLAELSERLQRVPKVRGVTSLSTVLFTGETDDGAIVIERLFRAPVEDPEEVRRRVEESPLYRDDLLSEDGRTTLISIQPETLDDVDQERGPLLNAVRAEIEAVMAEAERAPEWAWGGVGVIHESLNRLVLKDQQTFFSLSALLVVALLALTLRRVVPVLLALGTVYTAVVLLQGVYVGLGYRLNMVTVVLPSLVIVIGLTDSIYFITTYYQERARLEGEGLSKREAIVRCVGECALPGLFNSITASVGFFAFVTAHMAVIRLMGIFAGVGILLAFLMSVIVCAIGFDVFDVRPPRRWGAETAGTSWAQELLGRVAGVVARRHRLIVALGGVLFVVGLGGIARLEVDTFTIRYFYEDHPIRQADAFIEEHYGPYMPLELIAKAGARRGALTPQALQGVERLEGALREDPRVGSTVSLAGVVKQLHRTFTGDPSQRVVPDDPDAIAQELLFYDPERPDDPLVLTDLPRYERLRVTVRARNGSAREAEALLARAEAVGEETLPEELELEATGYVPLYVRLIDYLVQGQLSSLLTTGGVIFLVIAGLFRSWRYALLSLPPNVLPVAATLGFMGYAGIDLDASTVLIASIALGIAVDDTIHFLFRFKAVAEATGDDAQAVDRTLRTTGVAIASTSLIIAGGFSVISLASIKSVAVFGVLTAVTMLSALIGELLLTPAVILTFAPRRAEPT